MAVSEAQGVVPPFVPRRVVFDLISLGNFIPRITLFNKCKYRRDKIKNTMALGDMG